MNRKLPLILFFSGLALVALNFWNQRVAEIPANGALTSNDFQPKPVRVKISKLNVDAKVVDLGLNADQTLEVPKAGGDVGWYIHSPSPGALGPSVMVGHLDSVGGAAVFYNLKDLIAEDIVEVERADGSVAVFKVESKELYSQDAFPTEKVYGPIDFAGIRLITCSGKYNLVKQRYSENLVVYGSLVEIRKKS